MFNVTIIIQTNLILIRNITPEIIVRIHCKNILFRKQIRNQRALLLQLMR